MTDKKNLEYVDTVSYTKDKGALEETTHTRYYLNRETGEIHCTFSEDRDNAYPGGSDTRGAEGPDHVVTLSQVPDEIRKKITALIDAKKNKA